jgi:5'-3' exonuclease
MVELEADDVLAAAARLAAADPRAENVSIWTLDKDLGPCVNGERIVQVDRRAKKNRGGRRAAKFGVDPALIQDFLALVGYSADGCPDIDGVGRATAAR